MSSKQRHSFVILLNTCLLYVHLANRQRLPILLVHERSILADQEEPIVMEDLC